MASHLLAAQRRPTSGGGMWSFVRDMAPNLGTEWAIKFRVVRFYAVPAFGKNRPTLELVIQDQEKIDSPNTFLTEEIKAIVGTRGLFKIMLKKNSWDSSFSSPRTFGISQLITDPEVLNMYPEAFVKSDDIFWDDDEIENPSAEKIASSHTKNSARIGEKIKASVFVDLEDRVKKKLEDEFSSSSKNVTLKEVKVKK